MPYQVITLARIGTIMPSNILGRKFVIIDRNGSVAQAFTAMYRGAECKIEVGISVPSMLVKLSETL